MDSGPESYVICLKNGWKEQTFFGQSNLGVDNLFIPMGCDPYDSPAWIMAYFGVGYNTLDDFINYDIDSFVNSNPSYVAKEIIIDSTNAQSDEVKCYLIESNNYDSKQYVAYFSSEFTNFCFALAFQVFGSIDEYYDDFLYASLNSRILPVQLPMAE